MFLSGCIDVYVPQSGEGKRMYIHVQQLKCGLYDGLLNEIDK